jgi:hypothetical protein
MTFGRSMLATFSSDADDCVSTSPRNSHETRSVDR